MTRREHGQDGAVVELCYDEGLLTPGLWGFSCVGLNGLLLPTPLQSPEQPSQKGHDLGEGAVQLGLTQMSWP